MAEINPFDEFVDSIIELFMKREEKSNDEILETRNELLIAIKT